MYLKFTGPLRFPHVLLGFSAVRLVMERLIDLAVALLEMDF